MKKYVLIITFIAISFILKGNPIPTHAGISEFFINSAGNWQLEFGTYSPYLEYDSIGVESSTGGSVISSFTLLQGDNNLHPFYCIAVISVTNLLQPVNFDHDGDYVKLITYNGGYITWEYLAYGNYPGATLSCIKNGESAAYVVYYETYDGFDGTYCIDHSPSIGFENDDSDCMGEFSGHVFDSTGNYVYMDFFYISGFNHNNFSTYNGSFSGYAPSKRYIIDSIFCGGSNYPVQHIDFCVRPDSTIIQDIYLKGLYSDNSEYFPLFEKVTVSPNPFTGMVSFYINMKNVQYGDDLFIEIYDQEGKNVTQVKADNDNNRYDWIPEKDVEAGIFSYILVLNKKPVASGKIVKL